MRIKKLLKFCVETIQNLKSDGEKYFPIFLLKKITFLVKNFFKVVYI